MTVCNRREGHLAIGICFAPYNAGVVVIKNNNLFCTCCKKSFCSHVVCVQQLGSADYPEVSAMLDAITCLSSLNDRQNSNRSLTSCKSFTKIPFARCDVVTASLKYLDHLQPHSILLLMPDYGETCHQCGSDRQNSNVCESENIAYETAVICTNTKIATATGIKQYHI